VIASALAQASAATSADRYRVFKFGCPQSPGESLRPNCYSSTRPVEFINVNAAIFGRKSVAIAAKARRVTAWKSIGRRPDERSESEVQGAIALTSALMHTLLAWPGSHQQDMGMARKSRVPLFHPGAALFRPFGAFCLACWA
jgi:hypothetical protein